MQRLAGEQHEVVGDVHRQADRPHPHLRQTTCSSTAGDAAVGSMSADDAGDVAVAARHARGSGRSSTSRTSYPASLAGGGVTASGPTGSTEGVGRAGGERVLAGDPAHREAVAAVGRDVDLDDLVRRGRAAAMASWPGFSAARVCSSPANRSVSTMIPSWSSPRPSSALGADHAGGHVAVRLAGARSRSSPAACRPGRMTTTRSPAAKLWAPQTISWGSPVPLPWPTSTWQKWIVLPFFCGSSVLSRTRPTTSGPVTVAAVQRLLLQADADQVGGDLRRRVGDLVQADEFGEPTGRRPHQISIPNCAEKRASPSTMSCMSLTPLRS